MAFGALVLVPILTGLDSNVALFTAGVGTLLFQLCTRGKVPIFLASSPSALSRPSYALQTWEHAANPGRALVYLKHAYFIVSALVRWRGTEFVLRLLPPIVTGPVIMVIGLILAPVAVNMALGKTGDGAQQIVPGNLALWISMTSLAATVLVSLLGKGFLRLMPILCGIVAGLAACLILGVGDWSTVTAATTAPAAFYVSGIFAGTHPVHCAHHLADHLSTLATWWPSAPSRARLPQRPRHPPTMFGDGLATMAAGMVGGPPCTTYAEVIGAVSLTRVFNPAVMTWAALCAVLLSFVAKIGAFLGAIPVPVMGGIMILLFGAIMVVGLNTLVRARQGPQQGPQHDHRGPSHHLRRGRHAVQHQRLQARHRQPPSPVLPSACCCLVRALKQPKVCHDSGLPGRQP